MLVSSSEWVTVSNDTYFTTRFTPIQTSCAAVLRYSPYSKALTEVVRSGQLGDLINAVHIEPVGYFHFSHSFVRGNWKKESESSFSLMTKSCQ
jgi:predicted dehydrogenase